MAETPERLTISRLGDRGDGVTATAAGDIHVPRTLPGEIVSVAGQGERRRLLSVETASAERVEAPCRHFGVCGGCALQHWALNAALAWKRERLVAALARRGIAADVQPCRDAHGEGRRRATFHLRLVDGVQRAGFMEARSHDLAPIDHCLVLVGGLARATTIAESVASALARPSRPLDMQVTATETGLDIDIRGHGRPDRSQLGRLAAYASELDLARLSLHGETIVERRRPILRMGRALVSPPAGGFLQATALGEETLSGLVGAALAGARQVLDLFSGCGPFALRLAESAQVHAVDSDVSSLAALLAAQRETPGLRPVTVETRDLFRRPLLAAEIAERAVVFDPPRAGADAMARALAASRTRRVVAVSCDPESFARDAATLIAGGFRLGDVTPVDQFRYSAHVELVASFAR